MSTDPKEGGFVNLNVENGVGTITFYHPSHNSMPGYLLKALAETITQAGDRDDIIVVILKSEGERSFCAGASFDELISIRDFDEGKKFFSGFANEIGRASCRERV